MSDSENKIARMGAARRPGNPAWGVKGAGRSGNPGGNPSIVKDLKKAQMLGIPVEIGKVLDEWCDHADKKLAELGAEGFATGLREAIKQATARVLPMDLAEARAWWWRTVMPVFLAGPTGEKDSVWTYTSQEMGNRLLGKPKDTIALEGGSDRPMVDWRKVPEEHRARLGAAILELQGYLNEPDSDTEH